MLKTTFNFICIKRVRFVKGDFSKSAPGGRPRKTRYAARMAETAVPKNVTSLHNQRGLFAALVVLLVVRYLLAEDNGRPSASLAHAENDGN